MMNFFYIMSIGVSMAYLFSSNPISFMVLIMIQTILICLLAWMKTALTWFSFILFLIFLGGLMVLFIYIASLASNEKINPSIKTLMKMFIMTTVIIVIMIYMKNNQQIFYGWFELKKSLNMIYSSSMMILIAMAMMYLLFTLVVVVKVANKFNAPIKNLI